MVVRSSGFLGIPNPDRQEELFAVINQYKDPTTNVLDASNPDYKAAIDAINQKYADNMFMTPQQLQDANFHGMIQQASTGDTTSTTDDPLSMGSNQGALGNLDDDVELSSLNTTFEEDVFPAGGAVSGGSQTIGDDEYVLHGDYSGYVYRHEQGGTFQDDNVFATFQSPFLDFGNTEQRKIFSQITVFTRPEGDNTFLVTTDYDWLDSDFSSPDDYTIDSTGG